MKTRWMTAPLLALALLAQPAAAATDKVRILALIDSGEPLGFLYQTRGREMASSFVFVVGGVVPWVINGGRYTVKGGS
jgi:hypothetical protein